MKIISFTAIDKAGKHTQSELLTKKLLAKGFKVEKSEFHRYDLPTGKLIQGYLYAKQEDRPAHVVPYDVSKETIELIMAADKQSQQEWFEELEDSGVDFLVLDRYILDQLTFGLNNGHSKDWLLSLQKHMRQADLEIVIDIPAEESMNRKGKHGANDRYESDFNLLNNIRTTLLSTEFSERQVKKVVVDGLRDIDSIHEEIYQIIKQEFGV